MISYLVCTALLPMRDNHKVKCNAVRALGNLGNSANAKCLQAPFDPSAVLIAGDVYPAPPATRGGGLQEDIISRGKFRRSEKWRHFPPNKIFALWDPAFFLVRAVGPRVLLSARATLGGGSQNFSQSYR